MPFDVESSDEASAVVVMVSESVGVAADFLGEHVNILDPSVGGWDGIEDSQQGRDARVVNLKFEEWFESSDRAMRSPLRGVGPVVALINDRWGDQPCRSRLHPRQHVGVLLEREGDSFVAESLRYHLGQHAECGSDRGVGVAQLSS